MAPHRDRPLTVRETDLVEALRKLYPQARGWILLPQVRDATGAGAGRTADAIAMNAWPSRGLEVHGFEVKATRADWLRELRQPAKAESVFAFCDRWWLVTPDVAPPIVTPLELPGGWGHIVVKPKGPAAVDHEAPKLTPKPLDRVFVAALLRALEGCEAPEGKLAAAVTKARADGVIEGRQLERRQYVGLNERDRARYQRQQLGYLMTALEKLLKGMREDLARFDQLLVTSAPAREGGTPTG